MPSARNILSHLFSFLVIAIAFLLPAFPRTTGFLIAALTILWIADGSVAAKLRIVLRQPLALLFVSVYAAYLLGMIATTHFSDGAGNLLLKISLLLFPLFFFAPGKLLLPPVSVVLRFFMLGCVLCCIMMISVATYTYISTGTNHFTYTNLTEPLAIHPAYFSMYLLFSIITLLLPLLERKSNHLFGSAVISVAAITFFIVMIFLLSARQEMIALLLLMPAMLLYFLVRKKKIMAGMVISIVMMGSLLSLIFFMPEAKMRLEKMQSQLEEPYSNNAPNSVTMRKVIWQSAVQIIRQHPFGVGTGDVTDALLKQYKENNLLWPLNDKLNAHNQFLQMAIAIGIPGLVLFFISIAASFKAAVVARQYVYLLFLLLFLFCMITESMLESEAGVVFFSYFNALLARSALVAGNNESIGKTLLL